MLMVVDLPAPLCPSRQKTSPPKKLTDKSSSTLSYPKHLLTFFMVISGAVLLTILSSYLAELSFPASISDWLRISPSAFSLRCF